MKKMNKYMPVMMAVLGIALMRTCGMTWLIW